MGDTTPATPASFALTKPVRFSFWCIGGVLVLAGWFHLAAVLLATLFAYFALTKLYFLKHRGKWVPVVLFLFLLAVLAYSFGHLINQTIHALPDIADGAIPTVIQWAERNHIELPFSDYDSLKDLAFDTVKGQVHYLSSFARFARGATTEIVLLVVGCAVAIGLFLNPRFETGGDAATVPNNLYSLCCQAVAARFATFYRSFATVMGAQLLISTINTAFTSIFVLVVHLRYAAVVLGATFLCGLLPIVGNLISNTIIVGIAITVSPRLALAALIFLVAVHKLEYFLNSKIVGDRIRNPFWLTLLGLILGERLMGIPGMILAPVVLHYIKIEVSQIRVAPGQQTLDRPAKQA